MYKVSLIRLTMFLVGLVAFFSQYYGIVPGEGQAETIDLKMEAGRVKYFTSLPLHPARGPVEQTPESLTRRLKKWRIVVNFVAAMRKILLIVDLQKDFIDGALAVPGAAGVLPAIEAVKDRFDAVYFTLDWHPADHCSFREQGGPWPVHCVHYTRGAALAEGVLGGIPEARTRFICKGQVRELEEYGAFTGLDPDTQDLFKAGDEVTVCGIAAEYCVLESLKNLWEISRRVGFSIKVFLEGVARFETLDPVLDWMAAHGVGRYGG